MQGNRGLKYRRVFGFFPVLVMLALGALLLPGCSRDEVMGPELEGKVAQVASLSAAEAAALTAKYAEDRRAKDQGMLFAPDSPIAAQYKLEFKGLNYFPVDFNYRFKGPIHRNSKQERFQIMANDGELRNAIHWGYFKFTIDGKRIQTLQVYKMLDLDAAHSKYLFIPFIDSQAGRETYASGRYLDIEEHSDDIYLVDFNAAYNPYCAYGKAYSCPMAPRENRLKIPIPAGEKLLSPAG
jgi:uncharacterized protein